ncbi:Target of EGR1, member 1 (Nuclear) [Cyanidiococcus yangmingshanensis]|uniref:Target of EGR1, member 1 (Nuclear) n=1 Tax=Cyanidiococcus yangmingshanensis TaxID=2690220 RepID=A0A7J7IH70_9RHOD|nr:Target of EGR1, member 1 (Nuclear) [Cyanidiococcus yangmingshanensis]
MQQGSFSCTGCVFDRRNHRDGLEALRECLEHSTFLAIDTEFSGTGEDSAVYSPDLDERYEAIRRLSTTSAIFSVGIACFRAQSEALHGSVLGLCNRRQENTDESPGIPPVCMYDVHVLEFLFLCQDLFTVSGDTATFLAHHGMDFNRVFAYGIPYRRATAAESESSGSINISGGHESRRDENQETTGLSDHGDATEKRNSEKPPELKRRRRRNDVFGLPTKPLHVLSVLLGSAKPVILHNGLYDLMLMFAAFEAPLPPTIDGFMARLSELCPGRFFDTRVLEDFVPARFFDCPSYLEYLFRKHERRWFRERLGVHVNFPQTSWLQSSPGSAQAECAATPGRTPRQRVCRRYARFGYCNHGIYCRFSHDIDRIIDADEESHDCKRSSDAATREQRYRSIDSGSASSKPGSIPYDGLDRAVAASSALSATNPSFDGAALPSTTGTTAGRGALDKTPDDDRPLHMRGEDENESVALYSTQASQSPPMPSKPSSRGAQASNRFAILDELDGQVAPAPVAKPGNPNRILAEQKSQVACPMKAVIATPGNFVVPRIPPAMMLSVPDTSLPAC